MAIETKAELWQRIQKENPEIAEFIIAFNEVFGRPSEMTYELI